MLGNWELGIREGGVGLALGSKKYVFFFFEVFWGEDVDLNLEWWWCGVYGVCV